MILAPENLAGEADLKRGEGPLARACLRGTVLSLSVDGQLDGTYSRAVRV